MFSKEESKQVRQEFWTSFGKEYPRKWILYTTKIKEIQLKFHFTRKTAMVSMEVSSPDELIRAYYFEKLIALKSALTSNYLPEAIFEENFEIPEGKIISRVFVQLDLVNIHDRNDWPKVKEFLREKMECLEEFFLDFKDYLKA